MKTLKTFFIVIVVLILTSVVAAIIILKTFDLNKYLPQVSKEASKALAREVSVESGNLNLNLSGVVLEIRNVTIANDSKLSSKPFVKVARAQLSLDFWPLILKRVLLVKSIVLEHATVNYIDPNPKMPLNINASDVNIKINDFSLTDQFRFSFDAAVYSEVNNVVGEGAVKIDLSKSSAHLSDVVIKSNLGQLKLGELVSITPLLSSLPLPKKFQGALVISIPSVSVSALGLSNLVAHVAISDGVVALDQLKSELTQITVNADVDLNDIHLKSMSLKLASGDVDVVGDLNDYAKEQSFKLQVVVSGVKAQELIDQKVLPIELNGNIAGKVDLSGQGFAPETLYRFSKGSGEFALVDGVIERMNLIKVALGSALAAIPGLADSVDNLITGALKEKLGGETIVLDKAQVLFSLEEGVLHLDDAVVSSKVFDFLASGTMNYKLVVDMQTKFLFSIDASQAIAAEVTELGYLMNEEKRIAIAASITGTAPKLKYNPDVDLKRVATNALVEEGGKQLQKVIEENPEVGSILNAVFGGQSDQPTSDETAQPAGKTQQPEEKAKELISNVLGKFLK